MRKPSKTLIVVIVLVALSAIYEYIITTASWNNQVAESGVNVNRNALTRDTLAAKINELNIDLPKMIDRNISWHSASFENSIITLAYQDLLLGKIAVQNKLNGNPRTRDCASLPDDYILEARSYGVDIHINYYSVDGEFSQKVRCR